MKKLLLVSLCFPLAALQASIPQYSQYSQYPEGYPPQSTSAQQMASTYFQGRSSSSTFAQPTGSQFSQYPEGYPPQFTSTQPQSTQYSQYPQGYPSQSTPSQSLSSQYPEGYPPQSTSSQAMDPRFQQGFTLPASQSSTAVQPTSSQAMDPRFPGGFTLPSSQPIIHQPAVETTTVEETPVLPETPVVETSTPSEISVPETTAPSEAQPEVATAPSVTSPVAEELISNEQGTSWKTTQTYGQMGRGGKPFLVGFEFGNRAKTPVWIQVTNGDKSSTVYQMPALNPQAGALVRRNFNIDLNQPTTLKLWTRNPEGRLENPTKVYTFTPGKTIYVVYDPSLRELVRPTLGRGLGGFKKTESNLSMRNNVSQRDIQLQSGRRTSREVSGRPVRTGRPLRRAPLVPTGRIG